ncbi:MAG: HAD family hydrolase, partial [Spirochaetota bacterium]
KTVKTTSPLDGKSIWIEIFPLSVSKSLAGQYIADIENVPYYNIATVGNDYNDLDLLNWSKKSFVVSNAPDELKNKYKCVRSNNENGFTEAVSLWLGLEPEYLLKNN